jgi:hypothetical protein
MLSEKEGPWWPQGHGVTPYHMSGSFPQADGCVRGHMELTLGRTS